MNAPSGTRRREKIRARKVRAGRESRETHPRGKVSTPNCMAARYRGPVASVKRSSDCGSRHGVRSVDDDFPVPVMTASPGFVTQQATGVMNENGPLGHRSRTSDVDGRSRYKWRARASLGVSSGPVPFGYPWGTSPGPFVSHDGRDARVGRRDAPRLGRRGDDVAIQHLGIAAKRGERLAAAARGAGARTRLERAEGKRRFRAFARRRRRRRRPGRNGEVSVGTTEKDTANDIKRRLMTKETTSATKARLVMKRQTRNARRNTMKNTRPRIWSWRARAARSRTCARRTTSCAGSRGRRRRRRILMRRAERLTSAPTRRATRTSQTSLFPSLAHEKVARSAAARRRRSARRVGWKPSSPRRPHTRGWRETTVSRTTVFRTKPKLFRKKKTGP